MGIFGAFGKKEKEKEKCPLCGKEMSLFKQAGIQGGTVFICSDCERKLRGTYDIEDHWEERFDGSSRLKFDDRLRSVSLEDARRLIREREENAVKATAELGGEYGNIFKVEEVFNISPKALDVGIARAKAMKNKVVALGMMVKGSLASKDSVVLKRSAGDLSVNIIEVIYCSGSDFETSLCANTFSKKKVDEGGNAWLVLDVTDGVAAGDTICK